MCKFGVDEKKHLGGYIIGGDPNTYAPEIWDWMITFGIKSIIDLGCGEGYATKYFIDNGVEAIGIEGSIIAINNSPVKNNIILHDYTLGPFIPNKKYDAIWCCEFVEHVEEKYISNFLETFKQTKYIIMTHALPGQGGFHHVNEQMSDYWISRIEKENFTYDHNISLYLRKLTEAKWMKTVLFFSQR